MKKLLAIATTVSLALLSAAPAVTAGGVSLQPLLVTSEVLTPMGAPAEEMLQHVNATEMTPATSASHIDVANEGKNKIWRSKEAHSHTKPGRHEGYGHRYTTEQPQLRACLTYDGITCATFGPDNAKPTKKPRHDTPRK